MPHHTAGQLSMAKDWKAAMTASAPAWNIPAAITTELGTLAQKAETALAAAMNEYTGVLPDNQSFWRRFSMNFIGIDLHTNRFTCYYRTERSSVKDPSKDRTLKTFELVGKSGSDMGLQSRTPRRSNGKPWGLEKMARFSAVLTVRSFSYPKRGTFLLVVDNFFYSS